METLKTIKITVIAFFSLISSWLGILAAPLYILIALNMADYATGYFAAPYRGRTRSSDIGFRGIAKKVSMLLLVAIGGVVDWLITYSAQTVGISVPFHFLVAAIVAVWLICNEIISILENIGDIGVELPPFLMSLVRWVKAAAEDKAQIPNLKKDGDENE